MCIPRDVLEPLCNTLLELFGRQLLEEAWLRDLTDRWLPFAAVCVERRPAAPDAPVLPEIFSEFKALVFAISRCALANNASFANQHKTDDQHLQRY